MARYAIIIGTKVVNVIEASAGVASAIATQLGGTAVQSGDAGPGDDYISGAFTRPAVVVQIPREVSLRKLLLALIDSGQLGALKTAINALAAGPKAKAEIELQAGGYVQRKGKLAAALAALLSLSETQINDLFVAAEAQPD